VANSQLPVAVREHPHWRVVFRLASYQAERIPSLGACWKTVEQNRVSLRGWDYPHVSRRDGERGQGTDWIAAWSSFMSRYEYWRLFQSGQFVHLFSVREATESAWREKLKSLTAGHLGHMKGVDWEAVPGYIHITNFIYSMTEIFEFAARLCQAGIYDGPVSVSVELKGVKGFVLTTDWDRAWHSYYAATEDAFGKTWEVASDELVAKSPEKSLEAMLWFFERFGWLDPALQVLRQDQENFLKGRR
jgi:hypothetical protein